jgi:autotransporter-associated beta strand protein
MTRNHSPRKMKQVQDRARVSLFGKLADLSLFFRNALLLLAGLLAAVFLLAPRPASASTWANSVATSGTLVGTGTSGQYYDAATLAVGDAVYVSSSGNGLAKDAVYYVVGVTGTAYELSGSAGGAIASLANTAGVPDTTLRGVYTWDAAGATNTQGGASWDTIPNGVDAVATIASNSNGGSIVALQNPETVGTINFSATVNDLNLISTNNGTTTNLSAITFATSTGTPTINDTSSSKIIRLGLSDSSYTQGQLKISGTQGLILEASNASTAIRIENVDWSGFTDGNGGRGTLVLQSGTAQTEVANVLGSGTGAINLTVGNASTTGSAGAIFDIASGATLAANVLSGATNGYIYSAVASEVLTVGTAGGTGGNFAGVIGVNPYGGASANTTTTNMSLIKSGTGVQTISGQIAGASGATNTVTVNGGTLILSGSNSYGGATTVTAGTLSVTNTYALGATAGVSIGAAGTLDLRSDSTATFWGTGGSAVVVSSSASGATINVNQSTGAGSGQTITIGTFTVGATAATAQTVFTGTNNTSLSTGAATDATASGGTVEITNNIASPGTLTLASFADTRTGAATLQFDGSGNTTVAGAITQTGTTALTYAGSGTLTLGGSNTYTGVTTISGGGTLSVSSLADGGASSNIGASSNAASNLMFNGGTLAYTGASVTIDRGFTYSSVNGGTIDVTNAATNLNITGIASQTTAGGSSLTKTGAGTLTLSGTGDTSNFGLIVDAGEVDLNESGAPGSGRAITRNGVIINGGGIVKITGTNGDEIQNSQVVTVNNGTFNMNGKSETSGTLTIGDGTDNGIITGGTGSTYTNGNGATGTFNAESGSVDVKLAGGGTVLNKTTSGTVTLSQANTYTGATNVTGGALIVSGSLSGTVSTSVATGATLEVDGLVNTSATNSIAGSGATLRGTGTVGAVHLNTSANLAPGLTAGSTGPGVLTAGNVSFLDASSTFSIRLGINAYSDGDQLISTGITLDNTPLQLTIGPALAAYTGAVGNTYTIVNGGYTTGNFSYGGNTILDDQPINDNGFIFTVLYGNDGNGGTAGDVELELTAVPEPGTWAMMLGGMGMLAVWQTKRRHR